MDKNPKLVRLDELKVEIKGMSKDIILTDPNCRPLVREIQLKLFEMGGIIQPLKNLVKQNEENGIPLDHEFVAKIDKHLAFYTKTELKMAKVDEVPLINRTSEAYGPLIRSIDELQDKYGEILKEAGISLPRIIVIGTESAGKSSLLESIVGWPIFPRKSSMCTRLPFQLRLTHKKEINSPTVKFNDGQICEQPEQVYERVEQITKRVTNDRGVKDEMIVLEVQLPTPTELTLVDLPGIITVNKPEEPEDIGQQTLNLAIKYAKDPNTIILAVVDGFVRLRDAKVLQLVHELKAQNRTIGVLTKIDKCKDKDHQIPEKLSNPEIALNPHGYYGIINRSTEGLNQKLGAESFVHERRELTIVLGQENLIRFKDRLGIPALTKQLTSILGEHIGFKWGPETIAKIDKSISELSQEKQRLGNPITDKKNFLIRFFATLASTTKVELSKNSFKDLVSQNVKSTVSQASYRTGSSEADVKDTVVIFMKAVLQAVEKLSSILESILTKSLDNISTPEAKLSAYPFLKDEVIVIIKNHLKGLQGDSFKNLLSQYLDIFIGTPELPFGGPASNSFGFYSSVPLTADESFICFCSKFVLRNFIQPAITKLGDSIRSHFNSKITDPVWVDNMAKESAVIVERRKKIEQMMGDLSKTSEMIYGFISKFNQSKNEN